MLSLKLIRLIETHPGQILDRVNEAYGKESRFRHLRALPPWERNERVLDLLSHLGTWLDLKDEKLVAERFESIGRLRAAEGVPLAECLAGFHILKQAILDFAQEQEPLDSALQLFAREELARSIGRFFDEVIYYTALGYEAAAGAKSKAEAARTH